MSHWRVYYGDDTTFSDRDGTPFDAPRTGVQVIAVAAATPTGFGLIHTKDHYVWDAAREWWLGVDWAGLWDYLLLSTGPKTVLLGRTIRDEDFFRILGRATQEGLGS